MYRKMKDNSAKFVKYYENMMCHSFNPLQVAAAFLYPRKNQKTFMFSDVFRGYRKTTPGCNGLKSVVLQIYIIVVFRTQSHT